MSGARTVARNTGMLVAADVASKLALLALYAIMARELGTAGFGAFTVAISLALVIDMAGLGTDLILSREASRDAGRGRELLRSSIATKAAFGLVGVAAVIAISVAAGYDREIRLMIVLMAAAELIALVALSYHAILRGREEMGPPAKALVLQRWLAAISCSVALVGFGAGVLAVGALYLAAAVVALAYIRAAVHARGLRGTRPPSRTSMRWLLVSGIPAGAGNVFGALLARADAVILSFFATSAVVGLYGGAYRLFESTLFLSWAFGVAVYPVMSRLGPDTSPTVGRVYVMATKAITATLLPIGMAMAAYGPELSALVFGEDFREAGTAVRLLGGSVALYGPFLIATLALAARDRQIVIGYVTAAAFVLNIALNLALIPVLSLDGAALGMTLSQLALTVAAVVMARREMDRAPLVPHLIGPLLASAAVALPAALGFGLAGLAPALALYAVILVGYESRFHPDEAELARSVFTRRREPQNGSGHAADPLPGEERGPVEL